MAISSVNNINYAYLSKNEQMKKNAIPFRGEMKPSLDAQPTENKKKNTGLMVGGTVVALAALAFVFRKNIFKSKELNQVANENGKTDDLAKKILKEIDEIINKDGTKIVKENDLETGFAKKTTHYDATGKNITKIEQYDSKTGNKIKETLYAQNSENAYKVVEYNTTGRRVSEDIYKDGKIVFNFKSEYNPETGILVKDSLYNNGKLYKVIEKDPKSGMPIKKTKYAPNGKTIEFIKEYLPNDAYKKINFKPDGKKISSTYEKSGVMVRITEYNHDGKTFNATKIYNSGTLAGIENYTKEGKKIKLTAYQADGKTKMQVYEYDPKTGNRTKEISYQKDGKTLKEVYEYDPISKDLTSTKKYNELGVLDN